MFTGIVEEMGRVRRAGTRFAVAARTVAGDASPGSSIAVNGVCLTVIELEPAEDSGDDVTMSFDLSPETQARTALGRLTEGDPVNLERPVTLLTRLGGHLMQGHVDGVGEIISADPDAGSEQRGGVRMMVKVPDALRRYVAEKGSIGVNGVSLTVTQVGPQGFGVALIPFTLEATTLGSARPGDPVNLEVDVVAKYVEGFLRRTG